jgi:uroporphyrinogen-III synthase
MDAGSALAGHGVLITRPPELAAGLAALVNASGGEAILFPALEIVDAPDLAPLAAIIDRLESYDLAIFISPSAVTRAMHLVSSRRADASWPQHVRVAAIGRGSRRELEQHGIREVLAPPAHADSEALLALVELHDLAGRRVAIFRGEGGRELLGDTLIARGARVDYAECYRRIRPDADAAPLLRRWARGDVHAVTVNSAATLGNLQEILGKLGQRWLRDTPLFVPHARVADEASRLGVGKVRIAGASDEEMHAALVAYFAAAQ